MNILLVDNAKKSHYVKDVPLALLKLSSKHKEMGDSVDIIKAGTQPPKHYDIIYFSTIFLFNSKRDVGFIRAYAKAYPKAKIKVGGVAVTLMEDYYRKYCPERVEITTGLVPELDTFAPDYNLIDVKYSYGFTSRGCTNKCQWCCVPKIEGGMKVVPDWKKAIDPTRKEFKGMDNNILACPIEHIEEVFDYLNYHDIKVDFNQGMDCQLLMKREEVQKLFIKYPKMWSYVRFAWDSKRVDKHALATLEFLQKNKIRSSQYSVWYMLYDYDEPPQVVFERVQKLLKHEYRLKVKLMRYKDLTSGGLLRGWGDLGDVWAKYTNSTATDLLSYGTVDKWLFEKDYETFNARLHQFNKVLVETKDIALANKKMRRYIEENR